MLKGNRSKWVDSSLAKNQVEDVQQILKWISFNFQYDCDPGPKTNSMNAETKIAIEKFQKRYNLDFVDLNKHDEKFERTFESIDEDGKMGKETWGAFFDMYVLELLIVMGIKEEGLIDIQSSLDFLEKGPGSPAPVVGCGENFPKSGSTSEEANPVDRRVEILFFDETEEPELKCHPAKLVCKKSLCDLFNTKRVYKPVPVEVLPLPLPSGMAVRAHLKFAYKSPEGDERAFPKGFPFILKFGDGTSEEQTITSDNGQVFLQVLREKKSFTIEFKFTETNFIASPESGSDELVPESGIQDKIKNKFRVFTIPLEWNLKNSEWELSPTVSNFDDTAKEFKNLDDLSVENIGSEASPINMNLNPHWQYVKFLYFDRWVKKKLSLPSVLVEAFNNSISVKADILSNWITQEEASQAIPWIIRETNKPDKDILLRVRTKEDTYIETAGDESNFTRKLVTQGAAVSSDIGVNVGESVNINFNFANAFRLRFYDLPKLWKSSKYFAQLSGGKDAPAQKVGKFEDLASEETEDKKPLIISLDDIILTDKVGKPINWKPDEQIENRIAIFHHSFLKSGPQKDDLSSVGLYKPDGRAFAGGTSPKTFTGNNLGYFTQLPKDEKDRNYISDYPDWTRMIITQGNIFDVFDKRTEEGKGDVIGARAGILIFDVFSSSNTFVPPGDNRPRVSSPQKSSFCDI
ncbi:MAG TPA: peptidoglycan-binding domain-containing protein, partial [Ignavibacteriaceae bacterium]